MNAPRRICLGAFAGAHGVKGAAKVKAFTEVPEDVAAYGPVSSEDGARRFALSVTRRLKPGVVLVSAPEIAGREDAQALAGVRFYVDRSALPDTGADEFYVEDLIGLAAVTEDGVSAGEVAAAHNFGAGDILELDKIQGRRSGAMIPFTKDAVLTVDLKDGRITVAAAALAASFGQNVETDVALSDDTGEIVSSDLDVDLDAMRQEDA